MDLVLHMLTNKAKHRNFLFRLKTPLSFVNAANLIAIIFSTCHWSRIKLRMCILQVSRYFWEKSNFVIWVMALQSESVCLWTPETQGHQPWNFWADRIGFFTLYKQSVTYLVLRDELDPGHCLFTLLEILRKVGTVSQGWCQVTIDQCPSFKRVWCYTPYPALSPYELLYNNARLSPIPCFSSSVPALWNAFLVCTQYTFTIIISTLVTCWLFFPYFWAFDTLKHLQFCLYLNHHFKQNYIHSVKSNTFFKYE